jgi:hypothetical protein
MILYSIAVCHGVWDGLDRVVREAGPSLTYYSTGLIDRDTQQLADGGDGAGQCRRSTSACREIPETRKTAMALRFLNTFAFGVFASAQSWDTCPGYVCALSSAVAVVNMRRDSVFNA